jgi:hypothetical protein
LSETAGRIIVLNNTYNGVVQSDHGKIIFITSQGSGKLDEYDLIILFSNAISDWDINPYDEVKRREREFSNAISKERQICVLVYETNNQFFEKILARLGLRYTMINSKHELRISKPEFKEYLSTYGGAPGIFSGSNFIPVCFIPEIEIWGDAFYKLDLEVRQKLLIHNKRSEKDIFPTDSTVASFKGDFVAGLSIKRGQSLITFLPFFVTSSQYRNTADIYESIRKLIPALLDHRANTSSMAPLWTHTLKLGDQDKIEANLQRFREQMNSEQLRLDRLNTLKSILWLKHNELRDSVMDFLNEMQVATLKEDIGKEDFWILNNGERIAIVEVKGKDHGIIRGDLFALDAHRNARGKPDTFPAILIVNTHNKATNIEEKDQPISNEEVRRAVANIFLLLKPLI